MGIRMSHLNNSKDVTLYLERTGRPSLGRFLARIDLAGEILEPEVVEFLGFQLVLRVRHSPRGCNRARFGPSFLKKRDAEPMVSMAVGDVDKFEGLIRRNFFDPLDQLFCLADRDRGVDQNGFGLPMYEGTGD